MKNLKLVVAFVIATVLATSNSYAQATINNTNDDVFNVKYIGDKNGYLYFEVEIKDEAVKNKMLKITDAKEGELYVNFVDFKPKTQLYKIEKTESQEILFNLTIGNKMHSKSYTYKTDDLDESTFTQNTIAKN